VTHYLGVFLLEQLKCSQEFKQQCIKAIKKLRDSVNAIVKVKQVDHANLLDFKYGYILLFGLNCIISQKD